jgi:hypothetical protein
MMANDIMDYQRELAEMNERHKKELILLLETWQRGKEIGYLEGYNKGLSDGFQIKREIEDIQKEAERKSQEERGRDSEAKQ